MLLEGNAQGRLGRGRRLLPSASLRAMAGTSRRAIDGLRRAARAREGKSRIISETVLLSGFTDALEHSSAFSHILAQRPSTALYNFHLTILASLISPHHHHHHHADSTHPPCQKLLVSTLGRRIPASVFGKMIELVGQRKRMKTLPARAVSDNIPQKSSPMTKATALPLLMSPSPTLSDSLETLRRTRSP